MGIVGTTELNTTTGKVLVQNATNEVCLGYVGRVIPDKLTFNEYVGAYYTIQVVLSNGKTFQGIYDQYILTQRGKVALRDLKTNDLIICISNVTKTKDFNIYKVNRVKIKALHRLGKEDVYVIALEEQDKIIVNGGVVISLI